MANVLIIVNATCFSYTLVSLSFNLKSNDFRQNYVSLLLVKWYTLCYEWLRISTGSIIHDKKWNQ